MAGQIVFHCHRNTARLSRTVWVAYSKFHPLDRTPFRRCQSRSATILGCSVCHARSHMISLFGKNEPEPTLLERLKNSVSKTKAALSETVDTIFLGERKIDPSILKDLETALLSADLGVKPTREILAALRTRFAPPPSSNWKSGRSATASKSSNRNPALILPQLFTMRSPPRKRARPTSSSWIPRDASTPNPTSWPNWKR